MSQRNIDFAKLKFQYELYKTDIDARINKVLNSASFIMGPEILELEDELQRFTGAQHAITCSSGTDALLLALMALDIQPGDEVITSPFTFIATAETIALLGATPVFVDIEPDTCNIDARLIEGAITHRTKAIMPVSLYGQPADLGEIERIAKKHRLKVIIDGAQSFGAKYQGVTDSNLGDVSTTSFFPAKPLGCYGDGGAAFTNDDALAEKMRSLRVHGQLSRYHHQYIGIGGRLDTIQAAVLLAKLPHYEDEIRARLSVADYYETNLAGLFSKPRIKKDRTSVWAQYTLRLRDRTKFQEKVKCFGVPTVVHYPRPLHLQDCFTYLGQTKGAFPEAELAADEVVSLPMNAFLDQNELEYVVDTVNNVVVEDTFTPKVTADAN